jgi:hypothetical protein
MVPTLIKIVISTMGMTMNKKRNTPNGASGFRLFWTASGGQYLSCSLV